MSRKLTKITAMFFVVMFTLCMFMPLTVFAEDVVIVISGEDCTKMDTVFKKDGENWALGTKYSSANGNISCSDGKTLKVMDSKGAVASTTVLTWDGGTKLTFNSTASEDCEEKYYKQAITSFAKACTEAGVSTSCRQNIADRMVEADGSVNAYLVGMVGDSTTADIFTAMKWLTPILQFVRILIGVGVIIIVLLLVLSTVMDCVYIGFPVWREQQANKEGGSGKPFGVSMEALSTVKEIESSIEGGKYKNAYLLYFKRRAMTYIILAICILYLLVGELGGLIQALLNMVSGFSL